MTFQLDRVRFLTPSSGQGSAISVGAAFSTAYLTPAEAGAVDGRKYTYIIQQGNDIEIQQEQTYTASGTTIARGTPARSKIGGTIGTTKITLDGTAVVVFGPSAFDLMLPLIQNDLNGTITTGGSANAYTVTSNIAHPTLVSGLKVIAKANFANTGPATLNLTPSGGSAFGAKSIRVFKQDGGEAALSGSEIQANGHYVFEYDSAANSAAGAWILRNPSYTGRFRASAPTQFYIRPDGNDSNNGQADTAAGAWLTHAGAEAWMMANLDFAGSQRTVNVRPGSYPPFVAAHPRTGSGYVAYQGDPARAITGAANNGSGAIRLTVSTTGLSNGMLAMVRDVGGTTEANNNDTTTLWSINVIDATHLDLSGSTFTNAYTSGGSVVTTIMRPTANGQALIMITDFSILSVVNHGFVDLGFTGCTAIKLLQPSILDPNNCTYGTMTGGFHISNEGGYLNETGGKWIIGSAAAHLSAVGPSETYLHPSPVIRSGLTFTTVIQINFGAFVTSSATIVYTGGGTGASTTGQKYTVALGGRLAAAPGASWPGSTAGQDFNVAGPGAAVTDNTVARWDGTTGNAVQGSNVFVDDSNRVVIGNSSALSFANLTTQYQILGTTEATASMTLGLFDATGAEFPRLQFYRSKNATVGSATVVASGDVLGAISWIGAQQTGTFATQNPAARVRAEVDGTVTSGAGADMPGRIVWSTTPDGSGTLTDRMILDSSGALKPAVNDGLTLGTVTASFADGFFANGAVINFNNGNYSITHSAGFLTFGGGPIIIPNGTSANPSLGLVGSTTTGLYQAASGVLGVAAGGTMVAEFSNTPNRGPSGAATIALKGGDAAGHTMNWQQTVTSGTATVVGIYDGTPDLCGTIQINTTANTTAYNTSSDLRRKTKFDEDATDWGAKIDALWVGGFERKSNPGVVDLGIVAQWAQPLYPQAISYDEETDFWGADYGQLAPLALWGVKELRQQVKEMAAELRALRAELKEMRGQG